MIKNLFVQSAIHYFFSFICIFCFCRGTAQSSLSHYFQLAESNKSYFAKANEIEEWIASERDTIDPIQLSDIYNNFSKLNYAHKEYKKAIYNELKALEIQKKYIDSIPEKVNKTYNNLAYFYYYSGDEMNAIKAFKELIKQKHKDKYTVLAYTAGLANLFIARGDYFKLLDYLHEAERVINQQNDTLIQKEIYRVYLTFSRVYYQIAETESYHKAITYLKKAQNEITQNIEGTTTREKIIIYNRYGLIYDELKEYDKAISYYKQALSLSLDQNSINSYQIATIYNNLGYIYALLTQYEISYEYYQKGLQYDPFHTAILDNLGDYYLQKKDFKQALEHYQKAINQGIDNGEKLQYTHLPTLENFIPSTNKIDLVNDLKDKTNAWLQFYNETKDISYLQHALNTIIRADQLIDIIRSESYEQQSKFFWRKKGIDLYMLATSICYILDKKEDAFYFMEKSKSLSLLENLTHEEAKIRGRLPDSLQEKEYALKYNIYLAGQQPLEKGVFSKNDRHSLIFQRKRDYEEFLNSLEIKYPTYYSYKKEIDLVSFDDNLQKITKKNTDLIQYIISDQEGYGMYIRPDKTELFKIEDVPKLNDDILTLRTLLRIPLFSLENQETYKSVSFSIAAQLLPFIKDISSYDGKQITIVPDHMLQYIPFEILTVDPHKKNIKDGYLINYIEINYQYSITLSKSTDTIFKSASKNVLGFAPIYFNNQQLPDLRRSEGKMNTIKDIFDAKIFTKEQASKSNFIKESSNYRTIHLSTHASSMSNEDPWIAFYDDKLTLNELYFVKQQAELVILDACRTGIGELQTGEGIISLTRGFFHSGAKSVISSLWNTNEKSTNEIILNFYKHLKNGLPKSTALHTAKLDYIHNHQGSEVSPYFWGALVLHGNTDNVLLSNNDNQHLSFWVYPIMLMILLLLFIVLKTKVF